jgi:hypothetical protein
MKYFDIPLLIILLIPAMNMYVNGLVSNAYTSLIRSPLNVEVRNYYHKHHSDVPASRNKQRTSNSNKRNGSMATLLQHTNEPHFLPAALKKNSLHRLKNYKHFLAIKSIRQTSKENCY